MNRYLFLLLDERDRDLLGLIKMHSLLNVIVLNSGVYLIFGTFSEVIHLLYLLKIHSLIFHIGIEDLGLDSLDFGLLFGSRF